ncbi:MAG: hypothetical protein LBM16_02125 [Clostridiales bacterium]|jgi:hypothetical protein|nr:hypothetical protein [Clostridiales bacterium]
MKKIFISYTLRDSFINKDKLQSIKNKLLSILNVQTYIDIIDNHNLNSPQEEVIRQLTQADAVWVINSPKINESEWVATELSCANKYFIPIYYIDVEIVNEILNINDSKIYKIISNFL